MARNLVPAAMMLLAALAGCAAPAALPPRQAAAGAFEMEARFALRTERPQEAPRNASGRLSWNHAPGSDRILVADPMGQGIAEIDSRPGLARLKGADGRIWEATDAAALLQDTTGYTLPLGQLPAWLLGRPAAGGRLAADAQGRPQRLMDDGWQIDYGYDDDRPDALPSRLTVRREAELELRLRIESWRSLP